jgi:hypothetical protein
MGWSPVTAARSWHDRVETSPRDGSSTFAERTGSKILGANLKPSGERAPSFASQAGAAVLITGARRADLPRNYEFGRLGTPIGTLGRRHHLCRRFVDPAGFDGPGDVLACLAGARLRDPPRVETVLQPVPQPRQFGAGEIQAQTVVAQTVVVEPHQLVDFRQAAVVHEGLPGPEK